MKDLVLGFSPWGNGTRIEPFDQIFTYKQDVKEEGFEGIDALLLWGGQDIHPSFYKQQPHRWNSAPLSPSERDLWEWKAMAFCKAKGIPIIGVCRGAQFMCAFAGGAIIQHTAGHISGHHQVVTLEAERFFVTSAHHQMLDVHGSINKVLAWTPNRLSTMYYAESNQSPKHIQVRVEDNTFVEPEIVYFPEIKGLAIQGHPEWDTKDSPFVKACNKYIVDYLFSGKEWK